MRLLFYELTVEILCPFFCWTLTFSLLIGAWCCTYLRKTVHTCSKYFFSIFCLSTLCLVSFVIQKCFLIKCSPCVTLSFIGWAFFPPIWLFFKESIIFVLQTFFTYRYYFLFLDNYQVVFSTAFTCSYQSDDVCNSTDARKEPQTKVDITWILLLRYYIHLQRINNMSKLLGRFLMR